MREAVESDRKRILEYLEHDLKNCIYLYIDIINYGISAKNMKVWLEEDDSRLNMVVMKYYDSYQIYSHKLICRVEEILDLFRKYPASMISGRKDIIQQLAIRLKNYKADYGVIFIMDKYRPVKAIDKVIRAVPEEAEEIARLICSDSEIGGHYTVEALTRQLKERICTRTGRSYIIRENGEIAAHSATYAEADKIAVVGGTIIKQEYRNLNYYMLLSNYMLQQLTAEGKKAYTFSITDKMIQYHEKMHTKCSEYGKLVIYK